MKNLQRFRRRRRTILLGSPRRLSSYRVLAAAVIRQALTDAANPKLPAPTRLGARQFLAGSDGFFDWCAVAGLAPELVISRARERARSNGR